MPELNCFPILKSFNNSSYKENEIAFNDFYKNLVYIKKEIYQHLKKIFISNKLSPNIYYEKCMFSR